MERRGLSHDEITATPKRIIVERFGPLEISTQFGRVAAVDAISGDFEIGERVAETIDAAKERRPEGAIDCIRIGDGSLYRMDEPRGGLHKPDLTPLLPSRPWPSISPSRPSS